jgi:hypothetical protein
VSARSKRARRLAGLLTSASEVHVEVRYERRTRVYSVIWIGGPSAAVMYGLAAGHANEVVPLSVGELVWERRVS